MRMDIVAHTNVPMMVCMIVCFLSMTREVAMSGVKRKINGRYDTCGKRNRSVKKKRVE